LLLGAAALACAQQACSSDPPAASLDTGTPSGLARTPATASGPTAQQEAGAVTRFRRYTSNGEAIVPVDLAVFGRALQPGDLLAGHRVVDVAPTEGTEVRAVVQADDLQALKAELLGEPAANVDEAEDNGVVKAFQSAPFSTNDHYWSMQAGELRLVDWPNAYPTLSKTDGSLATVVVGVIDSGVDPTHPDLQGRVLPLINMTNRSDADECSHGTHVTGTLAAIANNDLGVAGDGPTSVLVQDVKILWTDKHGECSGSDATLAKAIDVLRKSKLDTGPVRVISMSLGTPQLSVSLKKAMDRALKAGILLVSAGGNDGTSTLLYPAAYDPVFAVAAVQNDGTRAGFSNRGNLDIAAPGVNIPSTLPGGGYGLMSGTSMATPCVSAAAALAWALDPKLTVTDVEQLLTQTATYVGDPQEYGAGVVDFTRITLATPLFGQPNTPPSVTIHSSKDPTKPKDVAFEATVQDDGPTDLVSYAWSIPDGSPSASQDPSVSVTFAQAGTFDATLTVRDGRGGETTAKKTVTIH
jgi:subtilisin family serine protease